MTIALANHADRVTLASEPGISPRAVRAVFKMMAKIANDAGDFRYGLRGSKLATLTDYSLSVVRRAQRYLVDHGYLERVEVGGGRASTKWRICVDKIAMDLGLRHTSTGAPAQQPPPLDTAQKHVPKFSPWMNRQKLAPIVKLREPLKAVVDPPLCCHGFAAGLLPGGAYRCPQCRREGVRARVTKL